LKHGVGVIRERSGPKLTQVAQAVKIQILITIKQERLQALIDFIGVRNTVTVTVRVERICLLPAHIPTGCLG